MLVRDPIDNLSRHRPDSKSSIRILLPIDLAHRFCKNIIFFVMQVAMNRINDEMQICLNAANSL